MSKAIILSRVSTQIQELDSQTLAVKNEALKEGFKEKDLIIIEDKESAIKLSEEERNGLNKMKEEINKDRTITHVFIYELSRLSRRQLVLFSIRDYLIERNIQLICCTPYFRLLEDGKLSQTANLMFSIFASMAESEMALKQERMKRGRMRNKMTGKNDNGPILFGYKSLEDKTIVIDEDKRQFVIDMFSLYATGQYSQLELAEELLQRYGTIKDTKYKMKAKINFMLKKREYCGNTQYEAIISEELFERARLAAKANKLNNNHAYIKDQSLLKKIIYDKTSGYHMTYSSNLGRPRYAWQPIDKGKKVMKTTIMTKDIDERILELAKMLHKEYTLDEAKLMGELNEKKTATLEKIMNLQLLAKKASKKIDDTEERLIYGSISDTRAKDIEARLKDDIKRYEADKEKLMKEMDHIEQLISIGIEKPDYDNFTLEEKRRLIRMMIKKVEIWKKSRYEPVAEVTPTVGSMRYVLWINSYNGKCEMTVKPIDDTRDIFTNGQIN